MVIAKAVPGRRLKVVGFTFTFADGNGCQFRSGLQPGGATISQLYVGGTGAVLSPINTGGLKGCQTDPGAPLILSITGSGTITGEVLYDLA